MVSAIRFSVSYIPEENSRYYTVLVPMWIHPLPPEWYSITVPTGSEHSPFALPLLYSMTVRCWWTTTPHTLYESIVCFRTRTTLQKGADCVILRRLSFFLLFTRYGLRSSCEPASQMCCCIVYTSVPTYCADVYQLRSTSCCCFNSSITSVS